MEEPFSARVYGLLNRPRQAKYQTEEGVYTEAVPITIRHFKAHLDGRDTLGLSCVDGGRANYLAVDVDTEFERRLPIFASVLHKRQFEESAFAINGSSEGRGKIVVTLANRLPQRQAIRIAEEIVSEAVDDPQFGPYKGNQITAFPLGGDGGFPRLFGRNLRRVRHKGLHEAPLDLAGDLSDLYYVKPAPIEREHFGGFCNGKRVRLSDWAQAFIEQPYKGNTPELFKAQVRLAHEALELHGDAATVHLEQWFRSIEERSPELSAGSRRNLLRLDVVKKLVTYASNAKGRGPYTSDILWSPKNTTHAPRPAARVYAALVEYVQDHGLDRHCFGIPYGRIAAIAGYASKDKAYAAVLQAEAAGLIVKLDPGVPQKRDAMSALYGLVAQDEAPGVARHTGIATLMYQARIAERARRGYPVAAQTLAA